MNINQLLRKLDKAWMEFKESYAGLSQSQMLKPGVTGKWSVKDIVAHVATWEEEALTHLPFILQGGKPPRYSVKYGGIDVFNALMMEKKCVLSLSEVLEHSEAVHQRLIEYLRSVPAEQFTHETRFRRRLRLDTYGHYPLHAKAIWRWREAVRE